MPVVVEECSVSLEWGDLAKRTPINHNVTHGGRIAEAERKRGMHLSGVLRYVALKTGLMKVIEDIDAETYPLRMALGIAWEEFAVSLYPNTVWQPGEVEVDGIVMTPDGLVYLNKLPVLEEFKCTWKKAKTGVEMINDEWYWMQQGRGYCKGYECLNVRWHVFFVNGDYRGSGPIYRRYLIRFSQADVESTWRMVQANLAKAAEEGHAE